MSRIASSPLVIVEAHDRVRPRPTWVANGNGRGYMSTTIRSYNAKPRLYVFVQGENIMENLAYRTGRPSKLYRTILPAAFEQLGLPAGTKASWSQYAGCSCPCSPGFVLDIPQDFGYGSGDRKDYYVTVEASDEAKFVASDENLAVATDRLSQLEGQGVFEALRASSPSPVQTARSAAGNLRNLKAMNDAKFFEVARAVAAEDNDPEAQDAVKEEAYRRATS